MRRAVFLSCLLALAGITGVRAQDVMYSYEDEEYGDSYDDFFQSEPERDDGPDSLEEARKQGRGYRIGSHGPGAGSVQTPRQDVHIVQEGDTLWDISATYFGDPWHWPEVWSYNPEITNPHWIYPMDRVRLSSGAMAEGGLGGGGGPVGPSQGLAAGTAQAPSVIVPRALLKDPNTVFLRDQAYLDQDALKRAGTIVAGPEEQMFLAPSDQVYVRFKDGGGVRAGQEYTVFRPIHQWERHEGDKGKLVRVQGTVVIRSYDRNTKIARGLVTEALDPIERGFYVAKMDRTFDLVPPKRNEANVVARIIASARPRELLSYGDIVFLDVGEGHGIQPGNRFFVVRRGDNWLETVVADPVELGNLMPVPPHRPKDLPKEVVAELRVLKVRKKTTIALVTRSDTDVLQGEVAEMRVGF